MDFLGPYAHSKYWMKNGSRMKIIRMNLDLVWNVLFLGLGMGRTYLGTWVGTDLLSHMSWECPRFWVMCACWPPANPNPKFVWQNKLIFFWSFLLTPTLVLVWIKSWFVYPLSLSLEQIIWYTSSISIHISSRVLDLSCDNHVYSGEQQDNNTCQVHVPVLFMDCWTWVTG